MNNLLVSICCITYNQVKYVNQAIDGFLKQKTNFDFEIIIGDDDSDDGTQEICLKYSKKHPNKIKYYSRNREDVIYINNIPSGRYNKTKTISQCTGKYIAICEGDDYWTDPYKLQKQVDFLEKNPEYIMIGSKVNVLKENEIKESDQPNESREIFVEDLFQYNPFASLTILFRNINIKYPDFYNKHFAGDMMLYFLLSERGKLYYKNEILGVYRDHSEGVTKKTSSKFKGISRIKMFNDIDNYFNTKFSDELAVPSSKIALSIIKNHYKKLRLNEFLFLTKTYFKGLL